MPKRGGSRSTFSADARMHKSKAAWNGAWRSRLSPHGRIDLQHAEESVDPADAT